ncbi:hypothetical protein DIPPA_31459, partial [Diplonema papillatum]
DTTGNLVVWDVSAGTPIVVTSCVAPTDAQRFPDLCKIVAMRQIRVPKYASESSIARTMSSQIDVPVRLLVMTPRSLVLMDVTSQTTVWKRDLGTSDCPLVGLSLNSRGDVMIMNTASTLKLLSRVGSPGSSKEITSVNVSDLGELQQAVYCPSVRSLAYLVFRNEVVLYDLEIRRCISDDTFKLSSGRRSEFRGLIQASGAEASALSTVLGLSGCLTLYTIHNDGTLNAWSRRPNEPHELVVPDIAPTAVSAKWKYGPEMWMAFTDWLRGLKWAPPGHELGVSFMELAVDFELRTGCRLPKLKNRYYSAVPLPPAHKTTTARQVLPE